MSLAGARACAFVPYDALHHMGGAKLELRLDQSDKQSLLRSERQQGREHELQRNEADIAGDHGNRPIESGFGELTGVQPFPRGDARIVLQLAMQLAVADVDGKDIRGAVCEQHMGEAAGRGADVETNAAFRIESESVERCREFDAAARHPGIERLRLEQRLGADRFGRLADDFAAGAHAARRDRLLRFGAAFKQTAGNEGDIGPFGAWDRLFQMLHDAAYAALLPFAPGPSSPGGRGAISVGFNPIACYNSTKDA